jgi:MerR family redox-sensitive transcriptional activator SoxR
MALGPTITIGELAARSGVATSALRFYEAKGLIAPERTEAGHRRYHRAALRRVAVIRAAQAVGLSLDGIAAALGTLGGRPAPTAAEWEQLSSAWLGALNARIAALEALRDNLDSCIGCGCLSLEACGLFNTGDRAASRGAGPRYLLGDTSAAVMAGDPQAGAGSGETGRARELMLNASAAANIARSPDA